MLSDVRECHEGVTRRDEYMPCERPAVAIRLDPEEGSQYPVCAFHARGQTVGRMVPLADVIEAYVTAALNEAATVLDRERDGWRESFDALTFAGHRNYSAGRHGGYADAYANAARIVRNHTPT